ncbi:MAG: Asp-tRNA(Asn)/Glu-tRNA(Gln) amidotransferase subunit GatC [Pseudomonadota bacterium]
MSLQASEVEKIAHLARLAIDPADIPVYTRNLSNIIDLVAQLQAVDTGGVKPMAHPLEMAARLRPDVVTETNQRDKFLSLAPQAAAGLYLVPKVIE